MPHDRNGQPLSIGDRVTLEAEIVRLNPSEHHCNATFRLVGAPDQEYQPELTCNSSFAIRDVFHSQPGLPPAAETGPAANALAVPVANDAHQANDPPAPAGEGVAATETIAS